MVCCLMLLSHYLNQCWLLIAEILKHSQAIILYNNVENCALKITANELKENELQLKTEASFGYTYSDALNVYVVTEPYTIFGGYFCLSS